MQGASVDRMTRASKTTSEPYRVAPNARLVEMTSHLTPGDALELGCGNGGDALWLAEHDWNVTALDISQRAVEQLTALAQKTRLTHRLVATQWDLDAGVPSGEFDLVNAHYLHAASHLDRAAVFRAAAHALRPGGHLLVVDHGSIAPWSWNQDPSTHFPSSRELHREIALDPPEWELVRAEADQRIAAGPDGRKAEVTDHILMIRRASDRGRSA